MRRVVVIGSGLGGLSTGVMLAKRGYEVEVLEKQALIGGCLQCFTRGGARHDVGMHFIGSCEEGQVLNTLFRYLGIEDIALSRLERDGYNVVSMDGEDFCFANGREAYIETLAKHFPKEKDGIGRCYDAVQEVVSASSLRTLSEKSAEEASRSVYYLTRSIDSVVGECVRDRMLANVLVGDSALYDAQRGKTPFTTHALIMDFYNQSAFRIVGGGDIVARRLAEELAKYGGRIRVGSEATKICCGADGVKGVEVNGSEFVEADYVVSSTHPFITLGMIEGTALRQSYRKRVMGIAQSSGVFSVYINFKRNTVRYMNRNYFVHFSSDTYGCGEYAEEEWPKMLLYMHHCDEDGAEYARSGVVMAFMKYEEMKEEWKQGKLMHRGEEYEKFKREKAERLIDALEKRFPKIRQGIESYYTSTPLSFESYTGTVKGGIYGLSRDVALGSAGCVSAKTPVKNLYMTGQSTNSHGMLGVVLSAMATCSEIVGYRELCGAIKECEG